MKTPAANVCTSRLVAASNGTASSVALYGFSRDDHIRVGKNRLDKGDEEMQACFNRLMQIVPTIPPNCGRMSKVQLLQHVIDYILDLENTLDFCPSESVDQNDVSGAVVDSEENNVDSSGDATAIFPPLLGHLRNHQQQQQQLQHSINRKPLTENVQVNLPSGHDSHQTSLSPSLSRQTTASSTTWS